jgi:hypothetical protein
MQLNILSRSVGRARVLGAGKVLQNTIKGLKQIGVDISLNEPISNHRYNWIHDAPERIIEAGFDRRPVLVGPNTATTPEDLPKFRRLLHPSSIYLFPSEWPLNAWKSMGFNECQCRVWAAGIELEKFPTQIRQSTNPDIVLIYFKSRAEELLSRTKELVVQCGSQFEVIRYGSYEECDYKSALSRAKYGIWIGGTESQGFALMEALASGLPLIVLDAQSLADNVHTVKDPLIPVFSKQFIESGASAAPYFDQCCGIKINESNLNKKTLEIFLKDIESFSPSSYVHEKFSLRQCAKRLVELAEELPDIDASSAKSGAVFAKSLYFLDLTTRAWPWKLASKRLINTITNWK